MSSTSKLLPMLSCTNSTVDDTTKDIKNGAITVLGFIYIDTIKPKTTNAKKTTTVKKADKKLLARDIAKNFRISSYDFLSIKRQNGIDDDTVISVSEFKKMYQKLLEGR